MRLQLQSGRPAFLGIFLLWIAVALNAVTLDIGKWIPNLGAVFKIGVFAAVIVGAVLYTQEHGMANTISFRSMAPSWNSSAQYIPVIIYGMLGFELVSASSEEMSDPARGINRRSSFMGIFGTLTLIFYGFLSNSNADLFWSLFAFSAVIFLLPYIGMLFAFIKSRNVDIDVK